MIQQEVYDEPIFLDNFAPPKPRLKYTYIHELCLPFRIYYIVIIMAIILAPCFMHGKYLLIMTLISHRSWFHISKKISSSIILEMRRQFISRFSLVVNAKASVITDLYHFLTDDSSLTSISDEAQHKLKFLLDSQDPEVVYDLRDTNPGRPQILACS